MKRYLMLVNFLVVAALGLSACGGGTPTATQVVTDVPTQLPQPTEEPEPTSAPEDEVLYLNLLWHQHQPLYYKNEEGIYTRPWVRVHATKDYYDMAYLVSQYPDVHVSFNLTPVLIKQLLDFAENGAKDLYWVMAEKPVGDLTDADKRFILERFFDANWTNIIGRFPRYKELLDMRGGSSQEEIDAAMVSFSEQDFRDLQIWFNLAWFDPMLLDLEPLKGLVNKGSNFTEEDKTILFGEVLRILQEVIPLHKTLQDNGQIEVTTTPYAHPILPLLVDTNLQLVGHPGSDLPAQFSYPQDALAHLAKSVTLYEDNFGRAPNGLWPGEGSVAQIIVPYVIEAGYSWMATGEPVLAKSLGIDFTRDGKETVNEADQLYRPYYVTNESGEKLAVFFRDWTLSDKIGFTYSGSVGKSAAEDLMQRLENIRLKLKDQNAAGPHVVSIILDGENAWEYYQNDGIEFLSALYQLLSESETIKTVAPSEYLTMYPEQRVIDDLFPGAWFSANYDTWIGESEENTAWNYLRDTRDFLAKYDITQELSADEAAIALAQDYMYLAEGSDWFWWYGTDQDSGQDSYFDIGYRALLRKVYESLGEPVPAFVDAPIIQSKPETAATPMGGLSTPEVDGNVGPDEWAAAAFYPNSTSGNASGFAYAMDEKNLYLRVDAASGGAMARTLETPIGFYFSAPKPSAIYPLSIGEQPQLLGVSASHAYIWDGHATLTAYSASKDGWRAAGTKGQAAASAGTLEVVLPMTAFGELEGGDEIRLVVVASDQQIIPNSGPAQIIVPNLGLGTVALEITDPEGDDNGPGTYTYPTDGVFQAQAYDLKSFSVAYDEDELEFKLGFYGPVPNPWGSPNGLSIQTIDIYVDQDPGAGTGARLLLPGRNASLTDGNGWELALWVEGWTPQMLVPDPETLTPKQITEVSLKILTDPVARTVTIRIPRAPYGEPDPAKWGYAVAILGQEGYPSPGVWRVRDIAAQSAQWKFGGAGTGTNITRIIDLLWPAENTPTQAEMLSAYPASSADPATLTADEFAQIELITIQ